MAQVNMVGSHDLWHESLGHPSNQVLSLISKDLKIHDNAGNRRPFDVCFCPKETRTPFVESVSHALELFELIHCDIWGGYKVPSFFAAQYFFTIVDDSSHAV